jgi:uracil-DNA glycosylase
MRGTQKGLMDWQSFIRSEQSKPYYAELIRLIEEDRKAHTIYPPSKDIFNAFKYCPLDKTNVVIIGQDCYHGPGQAHGLSFSVLPGVPIPPSLRNIFREINNDLGQSYEFPNGCLIPWAKQGVLLLNSILTVRQGEPGSHSQYGWQTFTDNAIKLLNEQDKPIVFLLWGSYSRAKRKLITTNPKHLVLESGHPSPFSQHLFFGNHHFSKCNDFLISHNIEPINWSL